ncbi:hypothetical protein BDN72DRAFT_578056 [Pluteus cervinus]|uniref:Uncharacterized protein n=1 Tax=Pluteus cervinus TaxID=181527 RepID=A0ACD3AVV7_9AGAR|nr:hypothetical protein BDN72DRAFT_578056 [Pluteus cervinus]
MLTFATPQSTQDPVFPPSMPISLSNPSYLSSLDSRGNRGSGRGFRDNDGAVEFHPPRKSRSRWRRVWGRLVQNKAVPWRDADPLGRSISSGPCPDVIRVGDGGVYSAHAGGRRKGVGRLVAGTREKVKQLRDLVKGFWVWDSSSGNPRQAQTQYYGGDVMERW